MGEGSLAAGVPGALEAGLDRRFARLAMRRGAVRVDPPYELSRDFLERVEFFASFPRRAVSAGRSYLPPATCYRLFQALEGTDLPQPRAVTLSGPCFRREKTYDVARRRSFTMREVVFLGGEERVREDRDGAVRATLRLARTFGLDAELEEAEDAFFADEGRAKRLLQRLMRLKLELVAPAGGERVALASFNLHQDFFGSRLGITVRGTPAWTACAAWGIERWGLALEHRWGTEPRRWPGEIRRALGLAGTTRRS